MTSSICVVHLGFGLAVGHQVAQTLDGLRPDVDMEVLDVLDHYLRGCGSWGRRSSGIMATASASMLASVGRCRMAWLRARSTNRSPRIVS